MVRREFYRRIKNGRSLAIDIGRDWCHWALPLSIHYCPFTTFDIKLVQVHFFCLFVGIEWYKYEETRGDK